jgi:peptide-methionine (R)-S-oxide reductase
MSSAPRDRRPDGTPYPVLLNDADLRARLDPLAYKVLREAGTEAAWSQHLEANHDGPTTYSCRACGNELFTTNEKFDSHCGWPSFFSPLAGDRVEEVVDRSGFMTRTEVRCANCGSHLGHVFSGEGFDTPTDLRYCINAVALMPTKAGE